MSCCSLSSAAEVGLVSGVQSYFSRVLDNLLVYLCLPVFICISLIYMVFRLDRNMMLFVQLTSLLLSLYPLKEGQFGQLGN